LHSKLCVTHVLIFQETHWKTISSVNNIIPFLYSVPGMVWRLNFQEGGDVNIQNTCVFENI